jgi:hypothetical protein
MTGVGPRNLTLRKIDAVWRHYGEISKTPALQIDHTTTARVFAAYREVGEPEAAQEYWNLIPSVTYM